MNQRGVYSCYPKKGPYSHMPLRVDKKAKESYS